MITFGGALLGFGVDKLTGGSGWKGAAIGGAMAFGATYLPPINFGSGGGGAIGGIDAGANVARAGFGMLNTSVKEAVANAPMGVSLSSREPLIMQANISKTPAVRGRVIVGDVTDMIPQKVASPAQIGTPPVAPNSTPLMKTAQIALLMNPSGGELRGKDAYGSGHFGASRDGGKRKHMGIDIITKVGQSIVSPITGTAVNYIGSSSGKPMIDITPADARQSIQTVRILYVNMLAGVNPGVSYKVIGGKTVIGTAANLYNLGYPKGITPHIHLQIKIGGKWINPTPYFFGR